MNPDLIILARGGVSIEDLWTFNDENLARTIFSSNIPIISAVGHETDFTISDFVADRRASTPSDAAKMVSINQKEMLIYFDDLHDSMYSSIYKTIANLRSNIDSIQSRKVISNPIEFLNIIREKLFDNYKTIDFIISCKIENYKAILTNSISNIKNLNPFRVLDRGYSFLTDQNGRIIKDIKEIDLGDQIYNLMRDGTLKMEVLEKNAK